ncbi:hypothetical protein EON65_19405 [archaeon]|nr:MAG: hypothetical protein EON65_19405 [archaeon]
MEFYHKELYTYLREEILLICEEMFTQSASFVSNNVDQMHASHPMQQNDIATAAVAREEDLQNKAVCINFDGDLLLSASVSAFGVKDSHINRTADELVSVLASRPAIVVVLYESSAQTMPGSILAELGGLSASLNKKWEEYIAGDKKKDKKLKLPLKHYKQADIRMKCSFAELYHDIDSVWLRGDSDKYLHDMIPVFILENIRYPGVFPIEPEYVLEDSDDDDAPVPAGKDEVLAYKRSQWEKKRPFRLEIPVTEGKGKMTTRGCYCESPAALKELLSTIRAHEVDLAWVHGNGRSLFDPLSTFNQHYVDLEGRQVLSVHAREAVGWNAVLRNLQNSSQPAHLSGHTVSMFPQLAAKSHSKPSSLAILGGVFRLDKLRVMDELMGMVSVDYFQCIFLLNPLANCVYSLGTLGESNLCCW